MKYRVGVDLGTASIGLAAVSLAEDNSPIDLVWRVVHLFDEPLENSAGGLTSKKAGRRLARMQRRQIDRRRGRAHRIAGLAPLVGVELQPMPDSGATLLELRAQAARQPVALSDLIRIFLRLSKRRGYAGEFRPKKKNAKLGEVEGGSNDLKSALQALAAERGQPTITLGEFLHHRWLQGLPTKLKVKEKRSDDSSELPNLYALRSQIEAEFEQIWETQAAHHPVLNTDKEGEPLKEIFRAAVFHQRPLKPVGGMVGQCTLEPTLPRAPRAQPAFQRFRIEKNLADLRWGAGRRAECLSSVQKTVIRGLLEEKETVSFKALTEALQKAGCPGPTGRGLNMDRLSREELHGDKTRHTFRKLGLGQQWNALDTHTQIRIINFLADLGSPEQLDDPQWHTRFVKRVKTDRKDMQGRRIYELLPRFDESKAKDQAFIGFINELRENEKFGRLSAMGFDDGRASYSVKALGTLADWLVGENGTDIKHKDEEAAIRACYPQQTVPHKRMTHLLAPKPTGNAVVDVALRQLQHQFNRMMKALGAPPTEVVVEMAREMGVGVTRRNEREKAIHDNRKAGKAAEKAISESGARITPSRIRRYLLWREQGEQFCPYCTRPINLADALNGTETEYEHILPRSLTQVGYKRSEIVLAHRHCNQEKGNRTPWDAWGDGRDPQRWDIIEQRAAWFEKNRHYRKARLLRLKDFDNEVLSDASIDGFADRQFHQTSWISKEAAQWLQSVCATPVSVSRGELTALLRRNWRLETVIPEIRIEEGLPVLDEDGQIIGPDEFERCKPLWEGHPASRELNTERRPDKRIDHRHHLIDAITIALTSRALFQQMARTYRIESEKGAPGGRPRLKAPAPPLRNVRDLALQAVRECPLTIKPDRYPDAQMFQEFAYGIAAKPGKDKAYLTRRHVVANLVDRKKGTPEQARKAIATIVSDTVREIISREFEKRLGAGMSAPAALSAPFNQTLYGKPMPIRKVCCYTDKYAEDAALIRHTSRDGRVHDKRLLHAHAAYAYLEIRVQDEKVVEWKLMHIQMAMMSKGKSRPNNVIRLYKGDAVLDLDDGKKYRICIFKAQGKIFLVPITEPRSYGAILEPGSGKKTVSFGQAWRLKIIN